MAARGVVANSRIAFTTGCAARSAGVVLAPGGRRVIIIITAAAASSRIGWVIIAAWREMGPYTRLGLIGLVVAHVIEIDPAALSSSTATTTAATATTTTATTTATATAAIAAVTIVPPAVIL